VCTLSISLSFGYPCSRSPLSVSALSLVVAVTFTVVGCYLLLLLHFSYLCPYLTVHTYVTMPTKLTSPRFDFGFGFASMPLLSSFFSILDLALVLALLSNTIALSIAKRQALLYLSVSFHSFGCLSPFVYHLLSFSFLLSPCTNHNFTISQPHRSIYLSSHPSSPLSTHPRSSRPYDENSAPRLACIPSLRFALFSFSLFG